MSELVVFVLGAICFWAAGYLVYLADWREDIGRRSQLVQQHVKRAEVGRVVHIKVAGPWPERPSFWTWWCN